MSDHSTKTNSLYSRWSNIKDRCYNYNNKQYNYYGGRGIQMDRGWVDDFDAFESYILSLPNADKGLTIDRINNDGNYEEGNLRWATGSLQVINRRRLKSNKSGYVGVSFVSKTGKWRSQIAYDGEYIVLGRLDTKEEAVYARNEFIVEMMLPHEIQPWRE